MSIQNEILNAIATRRSCRAYKPEQITAEELEAVTTAGTWAATAMGRQSPVMVAVQDKETLAELSRLNAAVMGTQNDPFYGAPTAVLVLGEKNNPNGVQDAQPCDGQSAAGRVRHRSGLLLDQPRKRDV